MPEPDLEQARKLVAEYRADGGNPDFVFKTTNAPNRVSFGEFIQAQMAALDVKVDLEFHDLAQFSSSVVQGNDFQLTTWVGSFDSPFPAVSQLLRSDGNANYGKYMNAEVDALLDEIAQTTDAETRVRDYQQIELTFAKDLPVALFSRGYSSTITRPGVKGMVRYPTRETFFATLWLNS